MKKLITSFALLLSAGYSMAQIGAVAPDFTVSDINGNSYNLYSILNSGKVVILDVSATWCGPCWSFHSEHFLEELNTEYGPGGTDQVRILFYEGDAATNSADLHGTGSNTQGDWVTGATYPIIDENPLQLSLNIFAPLGYPTINVICPSDKKIKADLWDNLSSDHAASMTSMEGTINSTISQCTNAAASVSEQTAMELSLYPNPTKGLTTIAVSAPNNGSADATVYSVSGTVILTKAFQLKAGSNNLDLDLSSLKAGTYFVRVSNSQSVSAMIPVVKQ